MPKKRSQAFLKPSNNYVHPSLASSSRDHTQSLEAPTTVNERLEQLRISQISPDSTKRQKQLADSSGQRSVPPALGTILGLPETAPPAPKPGTRQRMRLRTPGPAPPRSWLYGDTSAETSLSSRIDKYRIGSRSARNFGNKTLLVRTRPRTLCRFLRATDVSCVVPGSLVHIALRAIAENWNAVVEDGLEYLVDLPAYLRTSLISYLSTFGPAEGITFASLIPLLYGSDGLDCLDFTSLAGWDFSLRDLDKAFSRPIETTLSSGDAVTCAKTRAAVVESWDEEEEIVTQCEPLPIRSLRPLNQAALTKLSLANPPPSASWSDLLKLTKNLNTLTHLSLANWPFPSRTPGLKHASTTSKQGLSFQAGGSGAYSALDGDMEEASSVLRQLSRTTYCLRWLDLEGCRDWIAALAPSPPSSSSSSSDRANTHWADRTSQTPSTRPGPDWKEAWAQLTYLNLSRGSHPRNPLMVEHHQHHQHHLNPERRRGPQTISSSATAEAHDALLRQNFAAWLAAHPEEQDPAPTCAACAFPLGLNATPEACASCGQYRIDYGREYSLWLQREVEAAAVGRECRLARGTSVHGPLVVDFGWSRSLSSGKGGG